MRQRRVTLRRSLLTRLLAASALVAIFAVGATTWLAVTTTTKAIRIEQGQSLANDAQIYEALVGYAAVHRRWDGVDKLVAALSRQTGRVITLTTPAPARTRIAGSAKDDRPLPARASATVDALRLDGLLSDERTGRIDSRVVGPYAMQPAERDEVRSFADEVIACLGKLRINAAVAELPGRRPMVRVATGDLPAATASECGVAKLLLAQTKTEAQRLGELAASAQKCIARLHPPVGKDEVQVLADFSYQYFGEPFAGSERVVGDCVENARREQLQPYVAPQALLFVAAPGGPDPGGFELSRENTARIAGVAALVLAVTLAVTVVVGLRLVRPLRALISAAQRPADEAVRVRVTANDEIGYLAVAFNDLAERRQLLEDQRKSMVSDVAHELRSPLTNIRSWLEAAQDGITPANDDLIALLLDEAVVLQHVIDDLRDLAAADAGKLAVHRELLRVGDILEQVAVAHRGAADLARVRLMAEPGPDPDIHADPLRLRQVIGNLVSNAIRHTPSGGSVTLRSTVEGSAVLIEVRDTGSGIAAEDLPRVFDRFWRAERSRSRQTGGSGLGLAIARKLTEAHGGTITVASALGRGTAFTVRLPQS
jgi:two-component system sensor histidine kinase BaeS